MNPLYYVTFTTSVLLASFILFKGFNTTDRINTISLLCGFLVIFTGVYLLNLSRGDPDGRKILCGDSNEGIPTDAVAGALTRRSMQFRRSVDLTTHRRSHSNVSFPESPRGDRERLMYSYDVERGDQRGYNLEDLTEESEGDHKEAEATPPRTNGHAIKGSR